jgi:hypothetical protein
MAKQPHLKFTMSSILAFQKLLSNELGIRENTQLFNSKVNTDPTWAHLDWENGSNWLEVMPSVPSNSLREICLTASRVFVDSDTLLSRAASLGKEKLLKILNLDELQIMRRAGLLDQLPDQKSLAWWDYFRSRSRAELDERKTVQGRLAEGWQMQLELKITSQFGKECAPEWESLNGDHYGYDIRTYRKLNGIVQLFFVEVKSFASKEAPTFFLSRHEWNKAEENPANYLFAIWCIENKSYCNLTVENVNPYIPVDKINSSWLNIKITLDSNFTFQNMNDTIY